MPKSLRFGSRQGEYTPPPIPADIKKEGTSFDLPIVLGILAASEQLETDQLVNFIAVGELALTGAVLPIALRAWSEGKIGMLVPAENAAEAAVICGLTAIPIQNMRLRAGCCTLRKANSKVDGTAGLTKTCEVIR